MQNRDVHALLEGRLLLVTGKGGTGKSTVAAALAVLAAARGRRVLLAELDMSRSAMTGLFGRPIGADPVTVAPRLDVANVLYGPALEHFIGSVVPVGRIVKLVLDNPIVRRFLDFTPGAREMATLSRVVQYASDYDLVVVDLPASGHAFSLLDVTRSALSLFRSGPMRERAERVRAVLEKTSTRVALVALPEEMVVNETLETRQRFRDFGLLSRPPVVFLNRATLPTLTEAERTLLDRLEDAPLDPLPREFVAAGRWEDRLEQETQAALDRLGADLDPVLIPPTSEGGHPAEVLHSVAVALGRAVGVTRRQLPTFATPHLVEAGGDVPRGAPVSGEALHDWLSGRSLVVTVGSGGVGKTTSAAALGLYAARMGRKVMVLTIDPARRLANSLGLSEIGNAETRIDLSSWPDATGELWAMMLDSQSTMDNLIERVAEPDAAARILDNHIYRHMADTFAGSQDYMATEKLYDLLSGEAYDLIVLDTPPVKNALDFLESPGRLLNFLDEKVLAWFLAPRGRGLGWMFGTQAVVQRLLRHVFGQDFLDDLAVFFEDFQGLYDGFRDRHAAVVTAMRDERTDFLTICAPTQTSLDVAAYFVEELGRRDLPLAGVVVNQVHRCAFDEHDAAAVLGSVAHELAADLPPRTAASVLARLGMAHRRLHALVAIEEEMTSRLRLAARGSAGFLQEVPRLAGQVHDLDALHAVGQSLFEDAERLA
jgi:anion-transporting  ArsA/GET3 family ATPase